MRLASLCRRACGPRVLVRSFAKVKGSVGKTAASKVKVKVAATEQKTEEEKKKWISKEERLKRRAEKLAAEAADPKKRKYKGKNLEELIALLPKPADPKDKSTWVHKNGYGMKFFRRIWKYPEPCFWTLVKWKPRQGSHSPAAWGILTWRGVTEDRVRRIPGIFKRDWRFIPQPDLVWPEGKTPKLQLPEVQAAIREYLAPEQARQEEEAKARKEYLDKLGLLPQQHLQPSDTESNKTIDVGPWKPGKADEDLVFYNVAHAQQLRTMPEKTQA